MLRFVEAVQCLAWAETVYPALLRSVSIDFALAGSIGFEIESAQPDQVMYCAPVDFGWGT